MINVIVIVLEVVKSNSNRSSVREPCPSQDYLSNDAPPLVVHLHWWFTEIARIDISVR